MKSEIFLLHNYHYTKENFLSYLLYDASINKNILKTRNRNRIIFLFLFLSVLIYVNLKAFDLIFTLFFIPFASIMFTVREIIVKNEYVRRFERYLKKYHTETFEKNLEIAFTENFLIIKERNSENKISYKDFTDVIEIDSCIFIKLFNRNIITLNKELENIKTLIDHLKTVASENDFPYTSDLNWKWK